MRKKFGKLRKHIVNCVIVLSKCIKMLPTLIKLAKRLIYLAIPVLANDLEVRLSLRIRTSMMIRFRLYLKSFFRVNRVFLNWPKNLPRSRAKTKYLYRMVLPILSSTILKSRRKILNSNFVLFSWRTRQEVDYWCVHTEDKFGFDQYYSFYEIFCISM